MKRVVVYAEPFTIPVGEIRSFTAALKVLEALGVSAPASGLLTRDGTYFQRPMFTSDTMTEEELRNKLAEVLPQLVLE